MLLWSVEGDAARAVCSKARRCRCKVNWLHHWLASKMRPYFATGIANRLHVLGLLKGDFKMQCTVCLGYCCITFYSQ